MVIGFILGSDRIGNILEVEFNNKKIVWKNDTVEECLPHKNFKETQSSQSFMSRP